MNKQQENQLNQHFDHKLQQPLNLPKASIPDALSILESKLSVIRHTLSIYAEAKADEVLYGLVEILSEVQQEFPPTNSYCEQAGDILFPLWRSLQILGSGGIILFTELAKMDHD